MSGGLAIAVVMFDRFLMTLNRHTAYSVIAAAYLKIARKKLNWDFAQRAETN
jgi:hypothetical protein